MANLMKDVEMNYSNLTRDQQERLAALDAAIELYHRTDESFTPWDVAALAEYIRTGSLTEVARVGSTGWTRTGVALPEPDQEREGPKMIAGPGIG